MARLIGVGTLLLILGGFVLKGAILSVFAGVVLWFAALGFPALSSAFGGPNEKPVQAIETLTAAAPTRTPVPQPTTAPTASPVPTATLEPVELAWSRTSALLDATWEKDWQATVIALKEFLAMYHNHPAARAKLFGALTAFGDVLIGAGRKAEGVQLLVEADTMFPGKEAHLKLLALTPVPTATPLPPATATPIRPTPAPPARCTARTTTGTATRSGGPSTYDPIKPPLAQPTAPPYNPIVPPIVQPTAPPYNPIRR